MFFSYGARVMDEETLQLRRLKKNNIMEQKNKKRNDVALFATT
jgi:hypothetical protein